MKKRTLGLISANYTSDELLALTESRTVATIPFGGRYRLIDFPLSNLTNSDIRTVGLITPYYYRSIMDHIEAGKPWELDRKIGGLFVLPGTVYGERKKTSRFLIRDLIRNRRILDRSSSDFVLMCDTSAVMNCDLKPFIDAHAESGCPISLMYVNEAGKKNRTYIKTDAKNRVTKLERGESKLTKLFNGYLIINRNFLLDFIDWYKALDNEDIMEVITNNAEKYEINAYECPCYCGIIETIADYKKVSRDLLDHEVRTELFEQDNIIQTKISDESPTIYKPSASVKKSLVAAGCIIEGTVENSIIFRRTTIKKGAVVKDAIIMQQNVIEADATVINAICDKYVHIGRKTHIEGSADNPVVIKKNTII
ncbi:MAG: glucose-1-phosphate adenylyltransferase subunit GlgD [Bacillota bacterium]|nr:glucose-1-phosphate adenylyltransferase subunit GlgD [Bacillota bacterium]